MDPLQIGERRSIRLAGYDYAGPGGYFVTCVTRGRACLFGEVVEGNVRLNVAGRIAREEWFRTATLRPYVELRPDEFVVMPNHIHGIIWIEERDLVGAERRSAPTTTRRVAAGSLGAIVRAYKSAVTYSIHAKIGMRSLPIWQRNYYEHILRENADWERVCYYIRSNPLLWLEDEENPVRISPGGQR